jgi:hypothetical protein
MAISETQQKNLDELVSRLQQALGNALASVVLYGSAASPEFHAGYSDLNILCLTHKLDIAELTASKPVLVWWAKQKQPQPLFFSVEELERAADVFAIELVDMKSRHRVIFGADLLPALEVPMDLHGVQVERELRTNLLRLRQHFLTASGKDQQFDLLATSFSTFSTLFRHALIALQQSAPSSRREVIDTLAAHLDFDPAPFRAVLDVREGKRKKEDLDVASTFEGFLLGVKRVTGEVDRRLPSSKV